MQFLVALQIEAAGEANTSFGESGQKSDGEERKLLFFYSEQTQRGSSV